MEELRSTAIIDSEILEDSRKKAERILANSQTESKAILDAVAGKVETITKEKSAFYAEKVEAHKRDLLASLPLEKKRYLVEYEEREIRQAIVDYLSNVSNDKKLLLIKQLVKRYTNYLEGNKVRVQVAGFNTADILTLLKSELNANSVLECVEMNSVLRNAMKTEYGDAEGMIIETEDRSRLCRVFIGELIGEVIDKNNYELATTLFCGRLPE